VLNTAFLSTVRGNGVTRVVGAILSLAAVLVISGCGSTKLVTADKTVTYQGSIYNVSGVRQLTTRLEGETLAGETIDLGGFGKKRFEELVEQQGAVKVRTVIMMDDLRVVHEEKAIERGGDLVKMQENLADAYKDLKKFLAEPGKTQLNLKAPRR
jgi:hypothetical protein